MLQILCLALIMIQTSYSESCCSPSVVQGTAMEFGLVAATKTIYQNMIKFYYDAEEKKIAKITTSMMGEKVIDIADYSAKKRYVITNGTECNVTKLKQDFQEICVPSSAQFMGSTVLGNSMDNLTVDMYNVAMSKGGVSIETKLMVTPMNGGDCTLVGMVAFGRDKDGFQVSETSLYSNFTFEIPDKSVFKPPKSCSDPDDVRDTLLFEVLVGYQRKIIYF